METDRGITQTMMDGPVHTLPALNSLWFSSVQWLFYWKGAGM